MTQPAGRIGLVPARFGQEITGGAEIVLTQLAHRLQGRGWNVEILTTCALDHFSWENVEPAGVRFEEGLLVRRFPVVNEPNPIRQDLEHRIHSGAPLSLYDQQRWINGGMRVPELYHYLLDHHSEYRVLVFTPYMFWVAFACSQIAPARSTLWACLHDEPYAYLDVFEPVFTGLAGLFFMADPEHDLAHRIRPTLAPHAVVGCGVEIPEKYDPDDFRERYGIDGPFVLYAGRREGAKGWETLLDHFAGAVHRTSLPFSLVTMGGGTVKPPSSVADRVIDLGFLSHDDRDNAFAAADAYVQPSRFEAFSRTIMEAWLAGTPVIANAASEVVSWHCERSGAGLVYHDEFEFEQCLSFVAEAPDAARSLALSGRAYVLDNYGWEGVLARVEQAFDRWTPPTDTAAEVVRCASS